MTNNDSLLREFDEEMANTRKLLECLPESEKFSWQPHPKSMTLGRLASHVAEMPHWAAVTIAQDSFEAPKEMKPYVAGSKAELLAGFEKNVAEAREAIEGASDEHMAKTWSFIYGGQPVFSNPRTAVLRGMVMNHLIHHRGQLGVYLRLNDIAIPGMYGPSADSGTSSVAGA